ncbi:MAG: PPK2 family polyphosphate:nucleotide phosphotransferase [Bacteroidia bacterium]|jgi:PPK2 family polyphosphate:nucleotide phosphotransferase
MESFYEDKNMAVFRGENFTLKDYRTDYTNGLDKKQALKHLAENTDRIHDLQRMMYANDSHSVLLVFQAMDAAGKDSTIRKVFCNMFPQASRVSSFKAPTKKELDHDYLWRSSMVLPERGTFGIFNRSYYEEVLVTRVHPQYILGQRIPGVNTVSDIDELFWKKRLKAIRDHEEHLANNGTIIIKFFLNVSKDEQKNRFMRRIEQQEKNWKFNIGDLKERARWDDYMHAYEEAIRHTAVENAPWYVIPADNKWFMQAAVSNVVVATLERLNLSYPTVNEEDQCNLIKGKDMLNAE